MSINVDDQGDHSPKLPIPAYLAADWVDVADAIDRRHPEAAAEHAAADNADAFARFGAVGATSGVHSAYLAALREGHPRHRYKIPVAGITVSVTVTQPGCPPYDHARERLSWLELKKVVAEIRGTGDTTVIHAGLPEEVGIAVWEEDGHRVYVARPRNPASALSRAHDAVRRRWRALSPLPLLGGLFQPIAGSATAVGIVVAPVLPPVHDSVPPPVVQRVTDAEFTHPEPSWPSKPADTPPGASIQAPPSPAPLPVTASAAPDAAPTPPVEAAYRAGPSADAGNPSPAPTSTVTGPPKTAPADGNTTRNAPATDSPETGPPDVKPPQSAPTAAVPRDRPHTKHRPPKHGHHKHRHKPRRGH